jgi:type II secretory pathway pseudopilin PulG
LLPSKNFEAKIEVRGIMNKRGLNQILSKLACNKAKAVLRSEEGFTLVELMVVGGIVGFLMLGFSSYMYQQATQGQAQANKQNYSQLKSTVVGSSAQTDSVSKSETLDFTTFH